MIHKRLILSRRFLKNKFFVLFPKMHLNVIHDTIAYNIEISHNIHIRLLKNLFSPPNVLIDSCIPDISDCFYHPYFLSQRTLRCELRALRANFKTLQHSFNADQKPFPFSATLLQILPFLHLKIERLSSNLRLGGETYFRSCVPARGS